jgi:hypothetical protein
MAKSTIRGPVGHATTTVVPPIGRLVGHVPTATDRHMGSLRVLVVAWRLVWRFRHELGLTAVPIVLLGWLLQVLPVIVAWALWLGLVLSAVMLDRRTHVVRRWLARARFRRRWDRACRQVWLSNLNDRTPRVRRLTPVAAGFRLDIVVPAAVAMAELERNADTLASTMRVQAVRVVPDRQRADRAAVTVVHRDPLLEDAPTWPLLDAAKCSLWKPVPVGIDEDGGPVTISLPYRNVLVGGEPGGGKSVAVSQLLAVAALDPGVDLWLLDGKRVELGVWRGSAAAFVDTSIDDAINVLHRLQDVIDERLDWLDRQPGVRRKILRGDEQRLQVVVCDEYAFYTTTGDRKQVKEFEAAFTDLVARGRAAGVIAILATQKPHGDVISTGLRDLFAFRWALRCTTPQASDTVLGQGWAGKGCNAADLDPASPGVGWLLHEAGLPVRCRTHNLNDAQVETLAARAARIRAGTGSSLRAVS